MEHEKRFSKKYKIGISASLVLCIFVYLYVSNSQETSLLVAKLQRGKTEVKVQAAFELGQRGFFGSSAISDLAAAASGPEGEVRQAAMSAIANLDRARAVSIFTDFLSNRDAAVRMDAAEALERLGSRRAMAALERAQDNSRRRYRRTKFRGVVSEIRSEYAREKEKRYKRHRKIYGDR